MKRLQNLDSKIVMLSEAKHLISQNLDSGKLESNFIESSKS